MQKEVKHATFGIEFISLSLKSPQILAFVCNDDRQLIFFGEEICFDAFATHLSVC